MTDYSSPDTGQALKPCPFCGGENLSKERNGSGWPIVMCDDCGAKGPQIELDREDANKRWNARIGPAQSPRDAVIEECARHLEQEADLATNSLHCGDNSQTIAAVHRVSRTYYEAAKSIRDLVVTSTHSEAADEPKGGQ
jgi:Lar family restriction alleviation protein